MSRFVLVHGAWFGSGIWKKVIPVLERSGHAVAAPDLPGLGADQTPVSDVSLQSYVERTVQALDEHPEPAVLVGYSLGGAVISQAAEQRPDKIESLVYLAGVLLEDGETAMSLLGQDTESLLPSTAVMSDDQTYSSLRKEAIKETFCADCSDEDVERLKSLAGLQPFAPAIEAVGVSQDNFGRIPRVYIETLQDRVITPGLQEQMLSRVPCQKVLSMNTSHAPFFSAPEELANQLAR